MMERIELQEWGGRIVHLTSPLDGNVLLCRPDCFVPANAEPKLTKKKVTCESCLEIVEECKKVKM